MALANVLGEIVVVLSAAKNAGPVIDDLINAAEAAGVDVAAAKPVLQTLVDALAEIEIALKDAEGIFDPPTSAPAAA